MRWLRRLLVLVLVLAVALAAAGVWLVRRSFPTTDATVTAAGLEATVTVARDDRGVPVIEATTAHDLFFAQGYVHAQDRFWQMDTWRHIGAGRVSEMFGVTSLDTDKFLRTLGFERIAAEEYETMPEPMRATLDAYAEGVNAYLAERPGGSRLSLEYSVLGIQNGDYQPAPWDAIDTLTWAHVMAWDLRSNLEDEIERAVVAGLVGQERAEQLYPPYPEEHGVIVPSAETAAARTPDQRLLAAAQPALTRAARAVATSPSALGEHFSGIGSNNWVVDGSRTASGLPLLANDPHLGIQIPSIWYEVSLWCETVSEQCPYRVAGFSFPGAPGVVIGHNERIAWGVTNMAPDTMDLFIERVDGDRYEIDGEWTDLDVRTETISVAGGDDVELEIRSSRHGPLISEVFGAVDDIPDAAGPEYAVALAWQALEPSTVFQSLLAINRASNWGEFREAAARFDIAPQNLVYADVDGHIGYQSTGEIPIRASGDGRYPVPGWTTDHDWVGFIDFDDLPFLTDPDSGMIVTANQPVVDDGYDGFIGIDHAYGYRAQRITELLAGATDLTPADMTAVQMDDFDASGPILAPTVLALDSDDPAVTEIQDVFRAWQDNGFQGSAASAGAAAHAAVWRHLLALTFDELPEDQAAGGGGRYFTVVEDLLARPDDPWWDRTSTEATETAADIVARAVTDAHLELTERLGDDPADWRWGDLHVATFENQTLGTSGIGPIEALFNRTAPTDVAGGSALVNATGWYAPDGYGVVALPSMRMVVDLGNLAGSLATNTTGQSGHAYHGHYFDQVETWATGQPHPLRFDPVSVAGGEVLVLTPAE